MQEILTGGFLMRIQSVNYNIYPNFTSNNKKHNQKGLQNSAKAVALATALSASAPMYQSCNAFKDNVHNHYIENPSDTFPKGDLKPIITPPEFIIVEKPVKLPGDTIEKIIKDTVYIKPDTVFIKEEFNSEVPPKQEEIYDILGVDSTGTGKFFIKESYYDEKNYSLVQRKLRGQACSRDGKILVYDVIKTAWDDASEKVVPGKNETFERHLVYLSDDKQSLGIKAMKPKSAPAVENDEGVSNWKVFDNILSTPDDWIETDAVFLDGKGYYVSADNGFELHPAGGSNVTVINPLGAEWDLTKFEVVKGDAD